MYWDIRCRILENADLSSALGCAYILCYSHLLSDVLVQLGLYFHTLKYKSTLQGLGYVSGFIWIQIAWYVDQLRRVTLLSFKHLRLTCVSAWSFSIQSKWEPLYPIWSVTSRANSTKCSLLRRSVILWTMGSGSTWEQAASSVIGKGVPAGSGLNIFSSLIIPKREDIFSFGGCLTPTLYWTMSGWSEMVKSATSIYYVGVKSHHPSILHDHHQLHCQKYQWLQ